jgi:hypothetical protein
VPTALDNGIRSPRALLAAVVRKLVTVAAALAPSRQVRLLQAAVGVARRVTGVIWSVTVLTQCHGGVIVLTPCHPGKRHVRHVPLDPCAGPKALAWQSDTCLFRNSKRHA